MSAGLLVAALAGAVLAGAPEKPGKLEVQVKIDDDEATHRCRVYTYLEQEPLELALDGAATYPLLLAPGRYRLQVACKHKDAELRSWHKGVQVRSDKLTRQSVALVSGAVLVQCRRNGRRVDAKVEIEDAELDGLVAEGRCGNQLLVPRGAYQVHGEMPCHEGLSCTSAQPVKVSGKGTARVNLDLSDTGVKVVTLRNGSPSPGLVSLFLPGTAQRLLEHPSGERSWMPPGRYDMVVALKSSYDFEGLRLKGVELHPGQRWDKTVSFDVGSLTVDARLQGVSVGAKVYLYRPGAPEFFNLADTGVAMDLSPGRYKLRVILDESVSFDAARPQQVGQVVEAVVQQGRDARATIDFTPGVLTVNAFKNDKKAEAAVAIWLLEPRQQLTVGAAGEPIAVAAGTYDVEVTFPNGFGGDVHPLGKIEVPIGKLVTREIRVSRGSVTVDVSAGGKRADAQVRFYKPSSKKALAELRSGETAELPPGRYEVEAVLDEQRTWLEVQVVAGKWEVRKVELK